VGHRPGLDVMAMRKDFAPARDQTLDIKSIASHFTNNCHHFQGTKLNKNSSYAVQRTTIFIFQF
jgi:hypothetical protein